MAGSSILYGIAASLRQGDPGPATLVALAAAILSVILTGPAWHRPPGRERLRLMILPGILYAIAALPRGEDGVVFLVATASLGMAAAYTSGTNLILLGGPLIAAPGGLIALSSGLGIEYAMLPTLYALLTVPLATAVVTRDWPSMAPHVAIGAVGVAVAALAICPHCRSAGGLLLLDTLARIAPLPTGVYTRIPARLYGFHEAARTTIVLLYTATCPL